MKKIECNVTGMTCSSCEVLIERALKKERGVHHVNVDVKTHTARIKCDEDVDIDQLNNALQGKGYRLQDVNDHSTTYPEAQTSTDSFRIKRRHLEIVGALIIIGTLYFILSGLHLLPEIGVSDNMSYGFIFVMGLVAAMSTCLAVSGGLILALAAKYSEAHPNMGRWQRFEPHAYFNVGRVAGYTAFGALVGIIGSAFTLSSWMTGVITIAAATLMIIAGLQLLQIFPWLNRIQLKMPKRFAHKIYDASNSATPSKTKAMGFGALTFFLPCGFTQALQLYVLSTGSAMTGALTMLAFSLGTAPALISLGALSSVTTGKTQRHFTTFAALLVIILGVMNIPAGLSLAGISIAAPTGDTALAADVAGTQVVNMNVIGLEYSPSKFTVKKGEPVEWVIDGTRAAGCGRIITAPALGITEQLSSSQKTTIRFTPTKEGFYPFHCSMGMTTPGAGFVVVA